MVGVERGILLFYEKNIEQCSVLNLGVCGCGDFKMLIQVEFEKVVAVFRLESSSNFVPLISVTQNY